MVSIGRPSRPAMRRAAGASFKVRSATSTTKHSRSLAPSSVAYEATRPLSMPPDRNMPTGTSLRRRKATASRTSSSRRASASAGQPRNGGGHDGLQDEAVPRLVPDRGGEHPSDRRKGVAPQLLIEMGNEVHIGTRLQPVTAALEPGELLDVVIQFAVAHDGDGAVFVIDRLIAAGQIDDGQATHAQHGLVPVVPAHAIGAAVRQQADRVPDAGPGEGAIDTHESGYATHRLTGLNRGVRRS